MDPSASQDEQEERLLDVLNRYAGTFFTNSGSEYSPRGRDKKLESALKKIKTWDSEGLAKIRKAVEELLETKEYLKEKYENALTLLEKDGMKAIWKRWHQNRRLLDQLDSNDPEAEEAEMECIVLRSLTRFLKKKSLAETPSTEEPAVEKEQAEEVEKPTEEAKEAVKSEIPREDKIVEQEEKEAEAPKEEIEKLKEKGITEEEEEEL